MTPSPDDSLKRAEDDEKKSDVESPEKEDTADSKLTDRDLVPAVTKPTEDEASTVRIDDTTDSTTAAIGDDAEAKAEKHVPADTGEEKKGPAWLVRLVSWVEQHVVVTVVGFLLVTLIPTLVFYATDFLALISPAATPVMTGEWNVAVARFTSIGDETIRREDAGLIATVFYNRLNSEMAELSEEADIFIEVWDPEKTGGGGILGDTPDERAANAEGLAKTINADVIIYGTVERVGESLQLQPEFYVNISNYYEAEEVVGQHALGGSIDIVGSGEYFPSQINLNRELSRRSQALALVTRGLSLYFVHAYEEALVLFEEANSDDLWHTNDGREVVYLFQGNAAGRAFMLDKAEEAYRAALKIEPEYARGYGGLGSVLYLRSVQDVSAEHYEPDMEGLEEAIHYYEKALEAEIQPPTADVATKTAIGLGQIYLAQWYAGEDTLPEAIEQFELVIEHYGEGANPRVQEFASEAHARLGLIHRQLDNIDAAIGEFSTAIQLSTSPSRRGLYWATLADMYDEQGEADQAESANHNAIEQYTSALSLTTQDERRADYWAAIATRHERLGEVDEVINALGRAIELAAEDSEVRAQYESRLSQLMSD